MHRLFAALGPALIALLGARVLLWPSPSGPLAEGPAAAAAMLAEDRPRVVLVGNSLIRRGIDDDALAEALDLPEGDVRNIYVSDSRMPSWYAAIKSRIIEADHKPELIIVGTSQAWTLDNTLPNARARARLDEHLSSHDPVIASALGESESALLSRLKTRRVQLRESMLSAIRRTTISALGRDDAAVRPQLDDLFAVRNTDRSIKRVIPVAQSAVSTGSTLESTIRVEDALLDELATMCAAAGIKVVFAWLPVKDPSLALPAALAQQTVARMADSRAGFINRSDDAIPDSYFEDHLHLNERGKVWMTQALAADLKKIDALGSLRTARLPARLRAAPVLTRAGPLPEDDPRIRRWGEDAGWIAPGSTLRIQLPGLSPRSGEVRARISTHGRARGVPRLSMGETSVPLTGRGVREGTIHGEVDVIEITVPEGGPLALLHRLEVDGEAAIVLDGGSDILSLGTATVTGPEHAPRPAEAQHRDGITSLALGDLSVVENDAVFEATGERLCSPIRVLRDGGLVASQTVSCRAVTKGEQEAVCVRGEHARLRDDGDHDYAVALDAERTCGDWRWLYPGDALRLDDLKALPRGGSTLRLQAAALSEGSWSVRVKLRRRTLLETSLTAEDLAEGITLPLTDAIPPRPRDLTISISGDGFLALYGLVLGDEPLPAASPINLTRPAN